jgi:hypothetical protein
LSLSILEYEGSVDVDIGLLTALICIARDVEAAALALGPLPR